MTTAALVRRSDSSHWYYPDGKPCFELPKKDGTGMKVPTLADARKLNLIPSVTTILKVVHKEGLVNWMIEQAVLAVLTTPKLPDETVDAYTKRVLSDEKIQEQEAEAARERGSQIHDALGTLFKGGEVSEEIKPWVLPVYACLYKKGADYFAEVPLKGERYAGTTDLIEQIGPDAFKLWDWKTTKNLPDKGSWPEHRLQLSAYAKAWQREYFETHGRQCTVRVGNVYISTVNPGLCRIFEWGMDEWVSDYDLGFVSLLCFWMWSKQYFPNK